MLAQLLIFVPQSGQRVKKVSFLGFDGHMPFAVAMLFAAVGAVLFAATAANNRIGQLRRRVR